jgi:hypothetical protein
MPRPLLKGCLSILVLLALLVGWIAGARSFALVFDRMHTVSIDSIPVRQLGLEEIESGKLRINRLWMDLADPADRPFPVTFRVDHQHQVKVQSAGRSIVLGRINERSNEIIPAAGEDRVRFETDRGLSWPTPFEINFMTGHSPSWKRHLYYHLSWEKPDRSRLEMVWRYEQYYYDNDKWANGFMTRAGTTGLIRVDIRP